MRVANRRKDLCSYIPNWNKHFGSPTSRRFRGCYAELVSVSCRISRQSQHYGDRLQWAN